MYQAWELYYSADTVSVGVIDSGIDASHPDLINRVNRELSKDFAHLEYDIHYNPFDDDVAHGTHVAGIIGAESNNGKGIAGICPNVELISLKVGRTQKTYEDASTTEEIINNMVRAINYASENQIDMLNISMTVHITEEMIEAIQNYPGLIVCSAGNNGYDNDLIESYQILSSFENVMFVGASDINNNRSIWDERQSSHYGKNTVDVFAPGTDVYSTYTYKNYHALSGTSMAAPHVTGLAALLLSYNSQLTIYEIKQGIIDTVDKQETMENICVSGGRINAYKALLKFHRHSYTYRKRDKNLHVGSCRYCNNKVTEFHTWISNPVGVRCSKCGYEDQYGQIIMSVENINTI